MRRTVCIASTVTELLRQGSLHMQCLLKSHHLLERDYELPADGEEQRYTLLHKEPDESFIIVYVQVSPGAFKVHDHGEAWGVLGRRTWRIADHPLSQSNSAEKLSVWPLGRGTPAVVRSNVCVGTPM